jgi:hypothetical protein
MRAEARMLTEVLGLSHNNQLCRPPNSIEKSNYVSTVTLFISFKEIYHNLQKAMVAVAVWGITSSVLWSIADGQTSWSHQLRGRAAA